MSKKTNRPTALLSLGFLLVAIVVGAHISGIPLLLTKAGIATVLVFVYGYFAVRIVGELSIGSSHFRLLTGLTLGLATTYLTWAIRIPAFSGWDVAFSADPASIYAAVLDRASSMEISKGFGYGTETEGPSWLMLGTYILEALAFVGVMTLAAWPFSPEQDEVEVGLSSSKVA
ncbi:MAG: hypothetical protein ACI835_005724 [Planctomycetota bacterium]|jgi:hypothetical protein